MPKKKLVLKKVTVSSLENKELNHAKGGATVQGPLCPTGTCQWSVTPTACETCVGVTTCW